MKCYVAGRISLRFSTLGRILMTADQDRCINHYRKNSEFLCLPMALYAVSPFCDRNQPERASVRSNVAPKRPGASARRLIFRPQKGLTA